MIYFTAYAFFDVPLMALAALLTVGLVLLSGVVWSTWQWPVRFPNGLWWHIALGIVLALFLTLHMVSRFKPLRGRDLRGSRSGAQCDEGSKENGKKPNLLRHLVLLIGSRTSTYVQTQSAGQIVCSHRMALQANLLLHCP
jgi:hypothetical protein